VLAAWEFFAFVANSFVFLLIGIQLVGMPISRLGWETAAIAILLVLAGRAVAVYPISNLFGPSKLAVPLSFQNVLFWGGLRGALALALALAVPPSVAERAPIILSAFVVVAFSIFVQGLTMPWLVERLGLTRKKRRKQVAAARARP
jgi:CPA1 family monovalent cation:H+ antiporter